MIQRNYLTVTKAVLASAYGFSRSKTIMDHIKRRIDNNNIDKQKIKTLGDYRGHPSIFPEQVKIIVEILGEPQHPDKLYTEKIR